MKKFPIGFWNYPSVRSTPLSEVARWQNCGITCNQTPSFSYSENDPKELIAFLDEMHRLGLKAIVVIRELDFHRYVGNMDGYREIFERAYKDFGCHPATFCFFVGDEPTSSAEFEASVKAYAIMRDIAPKLPPFLNLHPYQIDVDSKVLQNKPFDEWLCDFIETLGCPLICYDCYTQMNSGEEGIDIYFRNLNMYTAAVKRKGISLWTTLLSVGHFRYRVPSEDDLRWQLSTAVASGCNGIMWFLYYGYLAMNNYRGAPVDELGEESDTYKYLRRVQLIFHRRHGEIMASISHNKTWHFHKAYGGYPLYKAYDISRLKLCESEYGLPGIVSLFQDDEGGKYIVLVNNSKSESDLFKLTFEGRLTRCDRYWDEHIVDFLGYHHDAVLDISDAETTVGFYLAPGQMEVLRVETK